MAYSSLVIANEFLRRAFDSKTPLTHMQVHKLVYLAHGWSLALAGRGLVQDAFEAWKIGATNRRLFSALSKYGTRPIPHFIRWGEDLSFCRPNTLSALEPIDAGDISIIDEVWRIYGTYPSHQLSALTHGNDTPWARFYDERGSNPPIPDDAIKEYFALISNKIDAA